MSQIDINFDPTSPQEYITKITTDKTEQRRMVNSLLENTIFTQLKFSDEDAKSVQFGAAVGCITAYLLEIAPYLSPRNEDEDTLSGIHSMVCSRKHINTQLIGKSVQILLKSHPQFQDIKWVPQDPKDVYSHIVEHICIRLMLVD